MAKMQLVWCDSSHIKLIYVKIHLKSELIVNHCCCSGSYKNLISVLGWIRILLQQLSDLTWKSRLQHLTLIWHLNLEAKTNWQRFAAQTQNKNFWRNVCLLNSIVSWTVCNSVCRSWLTERTALGLIIILFSPVLSLCQNHLIPKCTKWIHVHQ